MDEDVWMLEERLWLEGLNVYQDVLDLDPPCLMAFPVSACCGPPTSSTR
jgi:hypothetical protein